MRILALPKIPYTQIVVLLTLLGTLPAGFVHQGIPVLFPFIQEEFQSTRAQLGLMAAGILLGGAGSALLMGWLTDLIGVRRVQGVALIVVAGGVLLFAQIQSLVQGIILAFLIGVALSATGPFSAKAIMDWVPAHIRGMSMGIKETGIPISGIVVASLFPFLAVTFSWRSAVMLLALIIVVTGVVFFAYYRDKPGNNPKGQRSSLIGIITLLGKERDIWLVILSSSILLGLHLVFVSYLILFLSEDLDMSVARAGGFLAVAFVGGAVGRISWGLLSDLLGGRRTVVLILIGVLSMLFMASMTWLPSDASSLVIGMLVFLIGATAVGWHGVSDALIVELVGPRIAGTGIGFVDNIRRVVTFGFLPLFGFVVDQTNSYDMGWWMMAGLASAACLMLTFMRSHSLPSRIVKG